MTRDQVIAEAQSWVRVPFRKGGRSRTGVDCLGLLVVIGRALNVHHVDEPNYSQWPDPRRMLLKKLRQYLIEMPPNSDLPGLVGAFAEKRLPGHVGIFTRKGGLVHLVHARMPPPHTVVEEDWSKVPAGEFHLLSLFAFPGMEP